MTIPADWARIRALFHEAMERPVAERAAFVDAACVGEDTIRRELVSLLAAHDAAPEFLEAPPLHSDPGPDSAAPRFGPGARFSTFEILGTLGAGGMGEVYRARDIRLDRQVAIKLLPSAFSTDPERLSRFDRESRVLATLNHPHIGGIHSVEHEGGVTALILELVEGPTLAERLETGRLPLVEALSIARDLAEALAAAHDQGVVHRDLKPANVKITPAGIVKLLDFGLAKHRDPADVTRGSAPPGVQSPGDTIDGSNGHGRLHEP